MRWVLTLLATLLAVFTCAQESLDHRIPNCTAPADNNATVASTGRLRFTVIAHYSLLSSFFHNPEQAVRDAATIVGVEVEWDRHIVNTGDKMAEDIRDAVERRVDGLIVTIPDDAVYQAVQYALAQNTPVIVFNSGLHYAQQLGLTRVIQDDVEAGRMLGGELHSHNYSRPLGVHYSNNDRLDEPVIIDRMRGIHDTMGKTPTILTINSDNDTESVIAHIKQTLDRDDFDSVIAMGGAPTTDLITSAVLEMDPPPTGKRMGVGFFDIGSTNWTALFARGDVFGVSQLPYVQAALPVFLMYLQVITGSQPYINRTMATGPTLITRSNYYTFFDEDGSQFLSETEHPSTIGAVVPDTQGDTYESNAIAGMTELTNKLNWTLYTSIEDGSYGYRDTLMRHLTQFAGGGVNGLVLQSSDPVVVDYARNLSQNYSIPLTVFGTFFENPVHGLVDEKISLVNGFAIDMDGLCRSMAETLVQDNRSTPVCFDTHTWGTSSPFCSTLYNAYQTAAGGLSRVPNQQMFAHSLNLTVQSAMEIDFESLNATLYRQGYYPDAYVTLSEYVFGLLDHRMLRGMAKNDTAVYTANSLMDQKRAFLNGRVKRMWNMNTYSMGYLTILDILFARSSEYRPWRSESLDAPRVDTICPGGTYYHEAANFPFCKDAQRSAIVPAMQCLYCQPNTYNPHPNQPSCIPCPYGQFSQKGASVCTPCEDPSGANNTHCILYREEQQRQERHTNISVFVPLSVVIFLVLATLLAWFCWRRWKSHSTNQSSENAWLLSYDELMKPPMQHMSYVPSPSVHLSGNGDGVSPTLSSAVGSPVRFSVESERQFTLDPNIGRQQQQQNNRDSLSPNDPGALAAAAALPSSSTSVSEEMVPVFPPIEVPSNVRQQKHDNQQLRYSRHPSDGSAEDYFTTVHPKDSSLLLYYPGARPRPLHRNIGFHRNLPVFVKQIGFRRLHIDAVAQHELSLMKVARHPKLVEFIGLCTEPEGTFLVEEYCSKGTLYDVVNNPDIGLTWIFRFSLINDLVEGLEFLHRSKFMYHGCLTSQACFITGRWELKITDFGLHKVRQSQYDPALMASLGKTYPQLFRGPTTQPRLTSTATANINNGENNRPVIIIPHTEDLLWLAPEAVLRTSSDICLTQPSRRADTYSVGIIINEIVSRKRPFKEQLEDASPSDVFKRVEEDGLLPQMEPEGSDEHTAKINQVILDCLRRDPASRPSMTVLKNRIKVIDPHLTGSDNVVDNLATLLEQYANDMENLVRQRTANLQQRTLELEEERARTQKLLEDLKDAKEVAEAAAASKQNFLANMSHEIRTPMNAVIGMSRILMESNLPADLHDCAETIESSGNHLMAIIDDILDYSKIDSGKLNLEHRRLDLTYVVESALKLVSPNFLDKGLVLWYNIEGDVATGVYGDVVRLRQVLLNLLSNALKFTNEGHVCVNVKRLEENSPMLDAYWNDSSDNENSEPGCQFSDGTSDVDRTRVETLLISVKDTGVGIRPDKRDRLFQTFTQVDASTTRNYGGTGLGLAISRRLCHMMGGEMWLESEYGKGSTFFFRVVLQEQGSSPTYATQNRFDDLAHECQYCLVITENTDQQRGWHHILTGAMIPRVETLSFADAEELLKDEQPAVIIVDEEFEIVPAVDKEQATSSKAVLDALRARNPSIASVPALYISDARRRDKSDEVADLTSPPARPHSKMLLSTTPLLIDSPFEERNNPFDDITDTTATAAKTRSIVKPWKNSKMFSVLLELLEQDVNNGQEPSSSAGAISNAPMQPTSDDSTAQTLSAVAENMVRIKRRGRSNTTAGSFSSQSSASSSVPLLSEIASSIRSLLVDDNPVNQKVVARMLSRLGIKPEVAHNGKEACEMIEASKQKGEPIDLVFMDIWMPEMNGFEAAETIRKNLADSSLHPYIIAMTACVMPGDREKCIAAGMNGYVSKPVRKDELEASIHTYTQIVVKEMHMFDSDTDLEYNDDKEPTPSPPLSSSSAAVPSVTITPDDPPP